MPSTLVQYIKIITLCVTASIGYGILHDQMTTRLCIEYFTIGHPQLFVFPTESPTLLGIGWGIVATWWAGLILGVGLALAARLGRRPKRNLRSLVRPIALLLLVMAGCAVAAGMLGYLLAESQVIALLEPLATKVPRERHSVYLADLWAHNASYLIGSIGGFFTIVSIWRSRKRTGEYQA